VRIDMEKLRTLPRKKAPLLLILGSCILATGIGAYLVDLALRERRLAAKETTPSLDGAQMVDYKSRGSFIFETSEMMDRRQLTGEDAEEFTLPDARTGEPVQLQGLLKRPLVLIFGSYDCEVFSAGAGKVEALYQEYKDRIPFLFVQVAAPGHMARELKEIPGDSPSASAPRLGRARAALQALNFTMPSIVDTQDQDVQVAYEAYPKRMVLIEPSGKIVADSGRGMPNGWNFGRFEAELNAYLRSNPPKP
jgi:hypothetical protein